MVSKEEPYPSHSRSKPQEVSRLGHLPSGCGPGASVGRPSPTETGAENPVFPVLGKAAALLPNTDPNLSLLTGASSHQHLEWPTHSPWRPLPRVRGYQGEQEAVSAHLQGRAGRSCLAGSGRIHCKEADTGAFSCGKLKCAEEATRNTAGGAALVCREVGKQGVGFQGCVNF